MAVRVGRPSRFADGFAPGAEGSRDLERSRGGWIQRDEVLAPAARHHDGSRGRARGFVQREGLPAAAATLEGFRRVIRVVRRALDASVFDELQHRGGGGEGEIGVLGVGRQPGAAARASRDEVRAHDVVCLGAGRGVVSGRSGSAKLFRSDGRDGAHSCVGWSRTELLPRKLDERAIVRARESREGVAERAAPVARERQDHARSRALQLAQRRGVALANLDVLLQVQRRAAALVEQRDANLPRAVLRTAAMTVHAGGEGGVAPSFVGAAMAARGVRNVLVGAEPRLKKRATSFDHPADRDV